MSSLIVQTCCAGTHSRYSNTVDEGKLCVTRIIDVALMVIFLILGILGDAGVLPLPVGITFSVLSTLMAISLRVSCCMQPIK